MAEERLYLDLSSNSQIDEERNRDKLYKVGLKDQFERLQLNTEFEHFFCRVLPRSNVTVGISFPNFDRKEPSESSNNRWFNVAVRIPIENSTSDLVLMCDIDEYTPKNKPKFRFFKVKGFTLLDKNAVSCGEIQKYCDIFTRLYFGEDWYNINYDDNKYLSETEIDSSLLTIDFLRKLSQNYVVKDRDKVMGRLNKWGQYLDFKEEIITKDLEDSYSVDNLDFLIAYFRNNCPEEYRTAPVKHLIFKDRSTFWSAEKIPESDEIPLIHISHDFLKKDVDSDPNIKKKFEIFTRSRSLQVSEKVIIEEKTNGNKTEYIPRYNSSLQFMDESRVSTEPSLEEIQNTAKIDSIIASNRSEIESIKKSTQKEYDSEERSKLDYYKEHELVSEVNTFHDELAARYREDCKTKRESMIAEDTQKLDDEVAALNEKIKEMNSRIDVLSREVQTADSSNLDDKGKKNLVSKKNELEKLKLSILDIEKEITAKTFEKENLEDRYKLEDIVDETIRPFVDSKRDRLIEDKLSSIKEEIGPTYDKLLKTRIAAQNEKTKAAVESVKYNETRLRLHIFYRLDIDSQSTPEEIIKNSSLKLKGKKLFIYKDHTGDRAIIKRQRTALFYLTHGYVMNPFLATALFNSSNQTAHSEISVEHFYSRKLNDKQKEAIRKAVSSNGMFLIRGPPGTGKTEVIAEITAQLVTRGKKVLIASENHKAVDNAFQRLPEIPSLRRLRLFGGYAAKKNEKNPYSDKFLTRNLYLDIAKGLENEMKKTSSSKAYADSLDRKIADLRARVNEVDDLKKEADSILQNMDRISLEIKKLNDKISEDRDENKETELKISEILEDIRCIKEIERSRFDQLTSKISVELNGAVLSPEVVRSLYALRKPDIRKEYETITKHQAFFDKFSEKAEADNERSIAIEMEMLQYQKDNGFDAFEFNMVKLFPNGIPELDQVIDLKESISDQIRDIISDKEMEIDELRSYCNDTDRSEQSLRTKEKELEQLRNNPVFKRYDDARESLDIDIREILNDNNIMGNYRNLEEGIEFIEQEKERIKRSASSGLSNELMGAYRKMSTYLRDENVIENDSEKLNEQILDYVNVIGLTCTTADNITTDSGTVDIRRANIDVVIVDEVSKVSFLEVLYPILFGKTVILVGDDKQLPPMYQSSLSEKNLDRYDPSLVNMDLDREFKHMYESSFFKELYETMPACNKVMLTVQYRMHPDIMDADNIFYSNQLTYGGADGNREHYLQIKGSAGRNIINKNSHLLFIDVDAEEEDRNDSSTSRSNQREADVVINILHKLQNSCRKDRFGKEIGDRSFNQDHDSRLSLGVICGYADQVRMIRRRLKGFKSDSFNRREDEKFMVDTVDNFQGDERDIIILSLTATRNLNKSFMKEFNRINVAISRARCLLIIVGNGREFSAVKTDLDGRHEFVYRRIVDQAKIHHGYFTEKDVMGE